MALVTPLSPASKPLVYLMNLIADSKTWQAMVAYPEKTAAEIQAVILSAPETLSRTDAFNQIAIELLNKDLAFPRMIVSRQPGTVKTRKGFAPFETEARLMWSVEVEVPEQWRDRETESLNNQAIDFADKLELIWADMVEVIRAGTAERLQLESIVQEDSGLIRPEDLPDGHEWVYGADFIITYMGYC